ncbi:ORF142 [Xestia c-nigrum granulovirus]|uniref:ORF142 n=1 Tax=Xestia c-nigrum granulosis virus TaxID=51677 RepID=Q9PYQ4_GVXN|nr:ORF142 [Xestia c-nigrum granulovirus]AAF05256.1 ORF142 [Xestia c-nigrum granulovirus]
MSSNKYNTVTYRDASTNTCKQDFYNCNNSKNKGYNSNQSSSTRFTMGNLVDKVVSHEYAKQTKQKEYTNWLKSDAGASWQSRHHTKQW